MLDPGWAASLMCLDLSLISITSHPHLNLSSPFLPLLVTSLEFTGRLFWEVPPLLFNHQARSLASPCHLSATKWLFYHKRTRLITGTLLYACEVDLPLLPSNMNTKDFLLSLVFYLHLRQGDSNVVHPPPPPPLTPTFSSFFPPAPPGTQQPGRAGLLGAGGNDQLTIIVIV